MVARSSCHRQPSKLRNASVRERKRRHASARTVLANSDPITFQLSIRSTPQEERQRREEEFRKYEESRMKRCAGTEVDFDRLVTSPVLLCLDH